MHRDLKLENVLIHETAEGMILKIGDFGWACQYINDKKNILCGTPECIMH
jgi:serine/threonine protein kinase